LSGYNFSLQLIQSALGFALEDVKSILQVFINAHFLSTYDGNIYFFKNKVYFETIKKHLVKDEYEKEINFELFQAAKQLLSGDNFYCASLAVGANQNGEAYMLYGKATREALLVGDVNLYLKSQKSVLKLFDYSSFEDKDDRKKLLCEELGKANYISCPHDAIEFLTESLQLVSSSQETSGKDFKIMNLLGYLSKSFVLSGNFQGAIQAIDQSIGYLDTERMPLEYALLSSLKMKILLNLGQLGEVVSLAKNTIIPIYNDAIIRRSTNSTMSIAELKQSKQKALIMLARAYAMQGAMNMSKFLNHLTLMMLL
jgi:hypothetical protein